jgi:murein DD-endopeptidase MepM/ murein hydrolase activator NlpD
MIMKKIITITLLLIIVFGGFYYINNKAYQVEDINSVEIVSSNQRVTDQETLLYYLPLITQSEPAVNQTFDFSNAFDIVFNMKNDDTYHIKLIHDFEKKKVYFIKDENEVFSLNKENSLFFFKDSSFKNVYKKFDPDLSLSIDKENLKAYSNDFLIKYLFNADEAIEYSWNNVNQVQKKTLSNPNNLKLERTNSSTELLVYENDQLIHKQTDFSERLYVPEYDGIFEYVFQIKANHQEDTYVTKTVRYQLDIDRKPSFKLSHDSINQGHYLKITGKYVTLNEIQSIETLIIEDINFIQSGHDVVAYIPIHARTKPDNYEITIKTEEKYEHLYSVNVVDRDFKTQHLYVTASTMASSSNANAYAEYNKYFHPVRKISSEEQYYDENFIMPLKARITTEFGEGRYINDAITSYAHSGLDLAAPKGTPVHAINHGVVTLSRHFDLTGNTIIIDHGQGLLSYYLHLDTLNVELNDKVTTGDLIGTVGSTGRSTGPHLHFGTSFYTTYIEPGYFIYGEPITKENYEELFQ